MLSLISMSGNPDWRLAYKCFFVVFRMESVLYLDFASWSLVI